MGFATYVMTSILMIIVQVRTRQKPSYMKLFNTPRTSQLRSVHPKGGVEHGEVGIDELESGRLAVQDFPEERACFPHHVRFEGTIEFLVVTGVDGN